MRLDPHLERRKANYRPLTPLDFLDRAIRIFPDKVAVIWRGSHWTYSEFGQIVAGTANFLRGQGIKPGDVVSVLSGNRPELLAAHYAVPMVGAILNCINTRLDPHSINYILAHCESKILITEASLFACASAAGKELGIPVVRLTENSAAVSGEDINLLDTACDLPLILPREVEDEWQPICINYTSGTTGKPKGVVYSHRAAYLNAIGNVIAMKFDRSTRYLWVLPMFHCNGWCHTWAITAAGGVHVCLDRVDAELIFTAIAAHKITHIACAPVVLYMLLNHEGKRTRDITSRVRIATGGASPTSSLIAELEVLGFELIHLYGLTESLGPVTMRELEQEEFGLDLPVRAERLARQGSPHLTANHVAVLDREGSEVPKDGVSTGEIGLYGNTLMIGYYRDPEATEKAFAGDVFWTGDIAVWYPDGQIHIKDRSKDVIISGGENISSLEIESVLHQFPGVLLAAVVAAPDPKWGEIPVAFIETRAGIDIDQDELTAFCRAQLAGFKQPRRILIQELPKTATGKIQKFVLREIAKEHVESEGRA